MKRSLNRETKLSKLGGEKRKIYDADKKQLIAQYDSCNAAAKALGMSPAHVLMAAKVKSIVKPENNSLGLRLAIR